MELCTDQKRKWPENGGTTRLYKAEYHIFLHHKSWILYDIWQGIFCEIDALTKVILEGDDGRTSEEIVATLTPHYPKRRILDTCFELQQAGIFSTEPRELRPFAPPSRLEIVHVGLDLSDSTQEVACRAIDLLMRESGLVRQCFITLQGTELFRRPEFVRQIVDYGLTQAQRFEKELLFEVVDSSGQLDQSAFDGLDLSRVELIVPVDDSPVDLLPFAGETEPCASCENQTSVQGEAFGTHVRGTVDRNTLNLSERVRRVVDRYPKAQSVTFKFLALPPNDPAAITSADLPEALKALENLAEYVKSQVLNGEAVWVGDFEDCVAQVLNRKGSLYHCGAGTRYLAVTPEGKLYVCSGLIGHDAFCFGTVQEGIDRERQKQWIRSTHVEQFEACRECWARYLCGGGCRLNAFQASGDIRIPDPVICDLIRRSYELALAFCVDLHETAPERLNARYAEDKSNEHPVF